jgi:hypothetical protein
MLELAAVSLRRMLGRLRAGCLMGALAAALVVAGSGSTRPASWLVGREAVRLSADQLAARGCAHRASSAPSVQLLLRAAEPVRTRRLLVGQLVDVISRDRQNEMQFPRAGPTRDVCVVAKHRDRAGEASVVYRLTRTGLITFSSTFTRATNLEMPEMLGRVHVVGHALVPRVIGLDLGLAYSRLHAAGLRVSYALPFSDGPFSCEPAIRRQRPAAGRRVSAGTTVVLAPRILLCPAGSPAVPDGELPSATVPDFVGKTVLAASLWAAEHQLYWQANSLRHLKNANAGTLLANWHIRSQSPHPGATLTLGIARKLGRHSSSFLPTPLMVSAQQNAAP